jgi:hypothetical protein
MPNEVTANTSRSTEIRLGIEGSLCGLRAS